jgi:hypothetical protein
MTFANWRMSGGYIGELPATQLNIPLLIISRSFGKKFNNKANFDHKPGDIYIKK